MILGAILGGWWTGKGETEGENDYNSHSGGIVVSTRLFLVAEC